MHKRINGLQKRWLEEGTCPLKIRFYFWVNYYFFLCRVYSYWKLLELADREVFSEC